MPSILHVSPEVHKIRNKANSKSSFTSLDNKPRVTKFFEQSEEFKLSSFQSNPIGSRKNFNRRQNLSKIILSSDNLDNNA